MDGSFLKNKIQNVFKEDHLSLARVNLCKAKSSTELLLEELGSVEIINCLDFRNKLCPLWEGFQAILCFLSHNLFKYSLYDSAAELD